MKAQQTKGTYDGSNRNRRGSQSKLLLVGSEDILKSDYRYRIFARHQFRIAGRSTTLLDALAHLESEAIDLVLLSYEFCEEEASLFTFDAQRRGFAGLILHVASAPNKAIGYALKGNKELPGERFGQQDWAGDLRRRPDTTLSRQTSSELTRQFGSISFSIREQAVLSRVSEGWTNKAIADHLKCSEGSVKAILQQLFRILGVRKRAQIVRMAFENALMPLQEGHSGLIGDSAKKVVHAGNPPARDTPL